MEAFRIPYLTNRINNITLRLLLHQERLDIMSTKGYRPPYLSEGDLKALVRRALDEAPGQPNETYHARFDHPERGITLDDVIHGLERDWKYERTPEFNEDEWQWKYRIVTETVDGDDLTIIIAVDTANRIFEVLTRW
jgi:hypothetical protein